METCCGLNFSRKFLLYRWQNDAQNGLLLNLKRPTEYIREKTNTVQYAMCTLKRKSVKCWQNVCLYNQQVAFMSTVLDFLNIEFCI